MLYRQRRKYKLKPTGFLIIAIVILAVVFLLYLLSPNKDMPVSTTPNPSNSDASTISAPASNPDALELAPSSSEDVLIPNKDKPVSTTSNPSNSDASTISEPPSNPDALEFTPSSGEDVWNLILLGPSAPPIETDLKFDKTKFDSQYVDTRAANAYTDMYNAAKAEGITLFLRSGYRSMNEQRINYNNDVQRNMNEGYSKEESIKLTERFYTKPGYSEHHTGLAFDIITPEYHKNIYTLDHRFADTKAYTWLVENCDEYGFILRYPENKTYITMINYEPWHYRYVGYEAAQYIMANDLCLEEYLAELS